MVSTSTLKKLRPNAEAERGPAPLKPVTVYREEENGEKGGEGCRVSHVSMHMQRFLQSGKGVHDYAPPHRASGGRRTSSVATSWFCSSRHRRFLFA
jgi:hypothetical protein